MKGNGHEAVLHFYRSSRPRCRPRGLGSSGSIRGPARVLGPRNPLSRAVLLTPEQEAWLIQQLNIDTMRKIYATQVQQERFRRLVRGY
jgi:hypothetical protein